MNGGAISTSADGESHILSLKQRRKLPSGQRRQLASKSLVLT